MYAPYPVWEFHFYWHICKIGNSACLFSVISFRMNVRVILDTLSNGRSSSNQIREALVSVMSLPYQGSLLDVNPSQCRAREKEL